MLEAMLKHRPHRKDASYASLQPMGTDSRRLAPGACMHSAGTSNCSFISLEPRKMASARWNVRAALVRAVHALTQALFYSSCCLIGFWLLYAGSLYWRDDKYWKLPKNGMKPYFGCQHNLLGKQCPQQQLLYQDLLYMLLVPAVLATSSIVLLAFSASRRRQFYHSSCIQRWSTVMLPPRTLWLNWCDGMTVQDIFIISIWLTVNLSWFSAVVSRNIYQKLAKLHLTDNSTTSSPNSITTNQSHTVQLLQSVLQHRQQAERTVVIKTVYKCVARSLGTLLFPNLTLLFYPVARGSVVLQAFNIPYPAAIRYHRWLGHACLFITSTHAVLYWAIWVYEGRWLTTAFKQDPDFNYLFGGMAFLFGLALWVTSVENVRCSNYQMFKVMHHIGFWGWLVSASCHNWYIFWFGLPGLVLYGIDAVYRIHPATAVTRAAQPYPSSSSSKVLLRSSSGAQVLKVVAAPDLSMCSFLISCPGYRSAGTGFIWLSVPEIQQWGTWHPFEYITVPITTPSSSSSSSSGGGLLIHVKAYSRWTEKLVRLAATKGAGIGVRVQGPYAKRPGPVLGCLEGSSGADSKQTACVDGPRRRDKPSGLIFVAGGMGSSAVLSVLSELEAASSAAAAAAAAGSDASDSGLPILLIWVCRCPTEFEFMGPRVLTMAATASARGGGELTVKLCLTGPLHNQHIKSLQSSAAAPAAAAYQPPQQLAQPLDPPSQLSEDAVVQVMDVNPLHDSYKALLQPSAMQHQGTAGYQQPEVVTSPLCPVAAVGGLWAEAGHKLVMHVAVYASVFLAILVARYQSLIRPAEPWPTAQMGALYVALIVAAVITSGSTVLLLTQLVLKQQQKQQWGYVTAHRWSAAVGSVAAGAAIAGASGRGVEYERLSSAEPNSTQADVSLLDLECNKQQSSCSALQAVAAIAQAGVMGQMTRATPELDLAAATTGASTAALQLKIPAVAGVCGASSCPVEIGRPPLQQLVSIWLSDISQQTSAADAKVGVDVLDDTVAGGRQSRAVVQQQYNVYCMGPVPLVHSAMVMCDEWNKQRGRVSSVAGMRQSPVYLKCMRETWEL